MPQLKTHPQCASAARRRGRALLAIVLLTVAWVGLGSARVGRAQGHRLRFDRLSRQQGLSQVSVNAIHQDRQGYLWFATQDGLNRFDGYRFEVFRHEPGDPASLSENLVLGIHEDREGVLWVVTSQVGVLNSFDPRTETFRRFIHDSEDPQSLPLTGINSATFWEGDDGRLWFGTFGAGVAKLDRASGAVERIVHDSVDPESLSGTAVSAIFEDSSGEVWIGTLDGGLNRRLEPAADGRERFARYRNDPQEPSSLSHDGVTTIYEDRQEALWIGTQRGGVNRLNREDGTFRRFTSAADEGGLASDLLPVASSLIPQPIVEDSRGNLWVIVAGGISRLDPETERFVNYRQDPDDPHSLGNNNVSALLADRSGTVWIGTQGAGLSIWQPEDDLFVVVRNAATDPLSLGSDFIATIFESRSGILWFGTNNAGVSKYSPQKHKFKHYAHNPLDLRGLVDNMVFAIREDSAGTLWVGTMAGGVHRYDADRESVVERYFLAPGEPNDIGSNFVRAIVEDSSGRLWVGTIGGGLSQIDRATGTVVGRWVNVPGDPSSLSNNNVFAIDEDEQGVLWVGTGFGWNRFDPEAGTFRRYVNNPGDPSSFPFALARVTIEDRQGRLWVGAQQGLAVFDRESETFERYLHDFNNPASLSNGNIMDLYEDESGDIWVATYGGGLNRLDPETGLSTHWTTQDGLPNNSIYSVLPDGEGYYWLSTNSGLCRFDPGTEEIVTFDVSDGLQSIEFNGRAFDASPSGEMFFGGTAGFNTFFPDRIRASDYNPPVVLTAFKRFDQVQGLSGESEEIRISYKDKFIGFEFASLDFSQPDRNRYAYRLEGFDSDWVDGGTRGFADYTNLPGGHYLFRVRGTNGDGVWSDQEASIRLVVVPPPWKTWWAYGLYVLALSGMVFGYVRYKTTAHQDELERQRAEAENRRKTEELEQARRIQLSLVPDEPPAVPGLEIAAFMQTATEVGGDFYDFYPQPDGSLIVATGDATGHGLSAGMMVAMTKSALKALEIDTPCRLLEQLNRIIRAVNPERMQMAFSLLHIREGEVRYSSAGMPPVFVLRHDTREVEELLVSALPLGGMEDSVYGTETVDLRPGDTLLLISDGLPELLDSEGVELGYDRVPERLQTAIGQPAQNVIRTMTEMARHWAAGSPLNDDVTIVAIRRLPE